MTIIFAISLLIFSIGMCCCIFASKLAAFNNALVLAMPGWLREFYQRTISMGHPFDSSFWVQWNRIGGGIAAVVGVIGMVLSHIAR